MNASCFKASAGSGGYSRIVILLLLTLGVGVAVLAYRFYYRGDRTETASTESVRHQTDIAQNLLRGLAESKNRTFSDEQITVLKKGLSSFKGEGVSIECAMDDLKSCYLALELNMVFEASGWIVEEFLFALRPTPGKAVILRVKDESMIPRAEGLSRLFDSVGLATTTQLDRDQAFDLRIVVPAEAPPDP